MQIQSKDTVAILGIGRMATGLAVDMALNGCPADVIDIKPRNPDAMAQANVEALFGFLRHAGHAPIRCKSSPGFVISRLQVALMNEAVRIMEEGVASPEDIDRATTHGWGYRFPVMGILEFIDVGGLDILHHGGRSVASALNRPDLNSPALVGKKYAEGAYGTKTLRGLFDYGDGADLPRREAKRLDRQVRLKALLDQFQAEDDKNNRLTGLVRRTPLFSLADQPHLACKIEACQTSGSFKMGGAVRVLQDLARAGDARQVITVSMGNTAFSLAWAGRLMCHPVIVVMPETVSPAKLALTRKIGAEVVLHGQTGSDALAYCQKIVASRDCYFLHPHKCAPFLAGRKTIADEILADQPTTRRIYVPVGGGGRLSAICAAVERSGRKIEIVGVAGGDVEIR